MISQYPWKKDNSFGNTYSNIFGKIEGIEIAHIYLMDGKPDYEQVITHYYQIPEKEVMRSCLKPFAKQRGAGHIVHLEDFRDESRAVADAGGHGGSLYGRLLRFGKRHHWNLMFFAREVAWKFGKVDYKGMMDFVEDFKPELFFLPFSNLYYTNRLALYIKEHYDVPMVMEMAMDHYSLKRVSYNPLFWIDRLEKRAMIRKLAARTEKIYAISKRLKEELENGLHVPCEVLYKIPDENRESTPYEGVHKPVRFLFTGNIYANRWKSLGLLANALKKTEAGILDIYTANPITKDIDKALNIEGVSKIHAPVSQEKVIKLQNDADVLVHAEAFDKANKMLVRCAISTKIMDYLSVGRTILAIGPSDVASIEYLHQNDLALSANTEEDVKAIVSKIKNKPQILMQYAKKGRDYVKYNLNATELRQGLFNSLQNVVSSYKE